MEAFKIELVDEGVMSDSVIGWAIVPLTDSLSQSGDIKEDW